jgi:hypothetical protein
MAAQAAPVGRVEAIGAEESAWKPSARKNRRGRIGAEESTPWRLTPVAGNTGTAGATVTSRVLALLGAFDADHRALTLTEVAGRAGIALPTAHRLVGELVEWGALTRRASGEYVVGRRLWDVGLLAPVQAGLCQVASPFLHDLYGATLATVHAVGDPFDAQLQLSQLRWVATSTAAATGLAENYTGMPINGRPR